MLFSLFFLPFPVWFLCVSCPPTTFCELSLLSLSIWNYLLAPKSVRELPSFCARRRYRQRNHSSGTRASDPWEVPPLAGTPSPPLKRAENLKPAAVFHRRAKQASAFLRALFLCVVSKHLCFTVETAALLLLVLWNPTSHEAFAVSRFPVRPSVESRSLKTCSEVGSKISQLAIALQSKFSSWQGGKYSSIANLIQK